MDIFGNKKPIQIDVEEWWFNGRIILRQRHPQLLPYVSFSDNDSYYIETHLTKKEAINFCLKNPCISPKNKANDYL